MAVDQEARDLINSILAEFATRPDGGTWGVPADFSLIARQDQPPASGSSQFKVEDIPIAAGSMVARLAAGEIVSRTFAEIASDLGINGLAAFHNGTFLETMDASVSSDGVTITMSLEKDGTGDLTMIFSDGQTVLDCSPPLTIALTEGSGSTPVKNFIYIPQSTKVLTKSTTSFPAAGVEHIKIAYYFVKDAGYTQTNGPLSQQQLNDHVSDQTSGMGHLSHIVERLRMGHAVYHSGFDETITITGVGPSIVDLALTSGVGYQLHRHTPGSFDTNLGDNIHVVNDSVSPYLVITDLAALLTDALGSSMTNKYFNLVIWMGLNKEGTESHVYCNLPTGSYVKEADAVADIDGYTVNTVPREFDRESTSALMLFNFTFRHQSAAGGTWTLVNTADLRGNPPGGLIGGGSGLAQTTFSDSSFEVFSAADATKRLALDISALTTGTVRTLTMLDADIDLANVVQAASASDTNAIATFANNSGRLIKDGSNFTLAGSSMSATGGMSISAGTTMFLSAFAGDITLDAINASATSTVYVKNSDGTYKANLDIEGVAYSGTFLLISAKAWDAYTILFADVNNTPTPLTIGASTIVGRKSTGGIIALTGAEVLTIAGGVAADAAITDHAIVRGNGGTNGVQESTASIADNGVMTVPGIGDGGLTNYDLVVGNVVTDYGMIRIGESTIGRTSFIAGSIDLDGAILFRNIAGPVTGEIEFIFTESVGNTCRFAIPKSAVGNATYNPRSMLIAGPAPADTDFVKVSYWQSQGIFHNLACDTAGDGADLGIQNDLEVEGDIFTDSILESTAAAGVTIDSVLLKDGFVDGVDMADVLLALVEDITPELGGDLDVSTFDIVSTSNRNIDIFPHGTGIVSIGNPGPVTIGTSVLEDFRPAFNAKMNLGTTTHRWNDGFFAGTMQVYVLRIETGASIGVSTGVGSVKMVSANPADNVAWLPLNFQGTTYYVPAWTDPAP